jgi:hypothetical protein
MKGRNYMKRAILAAMAVFMAFPAYSKPKCFKKAEVIAADPHAKFLAGTRRVWVPGMSSKVRTDLRLYLGDIAKVVIYGPDGCLVGIEEVPWSGVPEIIAEWGKP